ncbi:sodium-coupled monocarboxylate transporter 1-like [Plakobranchus ocellatus]|uniref:Sodium-coupled monocarboxylate transporter 1-like n=1 Tax=Plakobranchus ocellatus TaxID=259542 RepID=A0AAV4C299_9GAST|nr:sodium-coupled monocarboxylate transporter 1-like [Plakobranchus ocellatus]
MQQELLCNLPGRPREPIFRGDYSFNTGIAHKKDASKYLVLVPILVSIMIGVYHGRKNTFKMGTHYYMMAGHSMNSLPVSLSVFGTFLSALWMLDQPELTYVYGTQRIWIAACFLIAAAIASTVFVPAFYELRVTSIYQVRLKLTGS